jgi:hypothetical protein
MISSLVPLDEIFQIKRDVPLLQITAPPKLMGDIAGDILRPFFSSVEADDPDRVVIYCPSSISMMTASRSTRPTSVSR